MVARWDAVLLVAALGGGSLLIESSHRLDTGAPDEEIVAVSRCAPNVYAWRPATLPDGEESDQPEATAPAPTDCTSE